MPRQPGKARRCAGRRPTKRNSIGRMNIKDRVIVVTGGAVGIGAALCRRFARGGARQVVVADVNADGARAVADEVGGQAFAVDVGKYDEVEAMIRACEKDLGRIDIFCSNAGIIGGAGVTDDKAGPFAEIDEWTRSWDVNVMSQVHAARAAMPAMLEPGEGYFVNTASAAGLLIDVGSMAYTATKHASVGLSEWMAVTYGDRGIRVSCLCPMGVRTPMVAQAQSLDIARHIVPDAIEPEQVAETVADAIEAERFLILPHPQVAEYFQRKAADPDRWLRGMARMRAKLYVEEP